MNMTCILRRSNFVRYVALLIATLFAPSVLAANTGLPRVLSIDFGGSKPGPVNRWDIDSEVVDFTTSAGAAGFADMTRDIHGRYLAYRTNYNGQLPALYQLDPHTGAADLLVESATAAPQVLSLTWLPDGDLFGWDPLLGLIKIDPTTLAYTPVPITNKRFFAGDLATAADGTVYAYGSVADDAPQVSSKLYTVDLAAGTFSEIGGLTGLSKGVTFNDIAFAPDGRLIGISDISAPFDGGVLLANSVYEIDLQTGLPQFLASAVDEMASGMRGFEFVPEPATAAYVWAAIVAIGHMRRRRA
jgi:hypothetical protein